MTSGPQWRTSSHSGNGGNCVEVAFFPDGQIGVRDSKDRARAALHFDTTAWNSFLAAVRDGVFPTA